MFTNTMRKINETFTGTPASYKLADMHQYFKKPGTGTIRNKLIPYMSDNQLIARFSREHGIPVERSHEFIDITSQMILPTRII